MNVSIPRIFGTVAIMAATSPIAANAKAPAGQYVVTAGGTGNGTVYDTKSKLTWQQTITSTTFAWADAKTYCTGVGASLRGTGWRLPTIKELQTIVDYSQKTAPMIDTNAFPGTPSAVFWSASQVAGSPSYAWGFRFDGYPIHYEMSNKYDVRCVR